MCWSVFKLSSLRSSGRRITGREAWEARVYTMGRICERVATPLGWVRKRWPEVMDVEM